MGIQTEPKHGLKITKQHSWYPLWALLLRQRWLRSLLIFNGNCKDKNKTRAVKRKGILAYSKILPSLRVEISHVPLKKKPCLAWPGLPLGLYCKVNPKLHFKKLGIPASRQLLLRFLSVLPLSDIGKTKQGTLDCARWRFAKKSASGLGGETNSTWNKYVIIIRHVKNGWINCIKANLLLKTGSLYNANQGIWLA